jgi:DNA invertase Pin-like site-specific DNA recombinase
MKLADDKRTSPIAPVPVAIYTRVSTAGQVGGRFDSCASQEALCRDYIASRAGEGWFEIACYTDAAYSGANVDRPGITALKHQIASGDIKVVLVFKLERLLRCIDAWTPFRIFLQQHGCKLISASEDLCEATPSGRLKNNIMVSVAEYERLNTAVKVRAKMLELAKRGYWNCGPVPFGYDYDSKLKLLTPNPTEASVVSSVFEDAANGLSIQKIVERLAAEGHRTKVRQWGSRQEERRMVGGKKFQPPTVRAMICNSIYAGRIRLSNQGYQAIHQALVTVDLWERANRAVSNATSSSHRQRSSAKYGNTAYLEAPSEQDAATPPGEGERKYQHAIHRALAWQMLRAKQPRQTTAEFARSVGVSVATVDFHFRLLKLAPEIQAFLLKLTDRASIRRFGLMRLQGLLGLDANAQRVQFAAMRHVLLK